MQNDLKLTKDLFVPEIDTAKD
ncbi:MAG: hypothetical protein K0R31_443, partial [Clostridiales bacterium]|nr:hypothetical protein [Clostridiales bacterium]